MFVFLFHRFRLVTTICIAIAALFTLPLEAHNRPSLSLYTDKSSIHSENQFPTRPLCCCREIKRLCKGSPMRQVRLR